MRVCSTCGACFDDENDFCSYEGGTLELAFPGPRVLGDRYLLEQRLAAGAMGVVFRAAHLQVGSAVAVKLMRPRREDLQVELARFHREAQILGQIKHPNAVLVMDFRTEQRGQTAIPYLVTEFLRGQSLDAMLEKRGQLTLHEAERIVTPLCEAVHEAHEVGVVHRDIKPSNIFLERLRDGTEVVKVLDFGIAKFVEMSPEGKSRLERTRMVSENTEDEFLNEIVEIRGGAVGAEPVDATTRGGTITTPGFMVGTVPYMAPEQITGGRISRRTDVYAIATVIWRLLAGRLPLEGDDDQIIQQRLGGERPSLRAAGVDVPQRLDDFLLRALSLRDEERPAAVMDLARELRMAALASGKGVDDDVTWGPQLVVLADALNDAAQEVIRWVQAPEGEEHYLLVRDRLLAVSSGLADLSVLVDQKGVEPGLEVGMLRTSVSEMERSTQQISRLMAGLRRQVNVGAEYGEYVQALWARIHVAATRTCATLRERLQPVRMRSEPRLAPVWLHALQPEGESALTELVEQLESRDALDSIDALDALLHQNLDVTVACLAQGAGQQEGLAVRLARALWRHADTLLMLEMFPAALPPRLLPLLTNIKAGPHAAFSTMVRLFTLPARAPVSDVINAVESVGSAEAKAVLWRCLLVHPSDQVCREAVTRVPLGSFWNVISHARTPVRVLRCIFERVQREAPQEYLKVFFLCVREGLQSVSHPEEMSDAFQLLHLFFGLPTFHEDVVFEPLLEVERALRSRCSALGLLAPADAAYERTLAEFCAGGVTESHMPDQMRDIPLPIQRKLAREGYFLQFFVCHINEKVARETIPHLLRMEDVTRFLRLPSVNRAVLVELSKARRLFRKESQRLALLQNPKTPAHVARLFMPLMSREQLRLLAANRHISAEVRQLALQLMEKLGPATPPPQEEEGPTVGGEAGGNKGKNAPDRKGREEKERKGKPGAEKGKGAHGKAARGNAARREKGSTAHAPRRRM